VKKQRTRISFLFLLIGINCVSASAQTVDFSGLVSTSLLYSRNENTSFYSNLRYIPQSVFAYHFGKYTLDALLSVDINSSLNKTSMGNGFRSDINSDLYRLQLRLSSDRYEARIGLQRINFGPGLLIRPLMWFEKLDPRDPLQMTKGVYSALFRYYFPGNINVWLWGLLRNKGTKGWEILPSNIKKPEYGGRIELPLSKGEMGFSVHERETNFQKPGLQDQLIPFNINKTQFKETKFGADLRLDFNFGLWSEMCLIHRDIQSSAFEFQKMASLGVDYTFSAGNGIYAAVEYFYQSFGDKVGTNLYPAKLFALTVNYPLDMINSVSAIFFYNDSSKDWYRFVQFKMTYDKFQIFLISFINSGNLPISNSAYQAFSGKGFEFMFLYNH